MNYSVETTARFDKEFRKLDHYTQRMLKGWIDKNLVNADNPLRSGKGLTANRSGQWRYRIGDYRLICQIDDGRLVILALSVGHRNEVYNNLMETLYLISIPGMKEIIVEGLRTPSEECLSEDEVEW